MARSLEHPQPEATPEGYIPAKVSPDGYDIVSPRSFELFRMGIASEIGQRLPGGTCRVHPEYPADIEPLGNPMALAWYLHKLTHDPTFLMPHIDRHRVGCIQSLFDRGNYVAYVSPPVVPTMRTNHELLLARNIHSRFAGHYMAGVMDHLVRKNYLFLDTSVITDIARIFFYLGYSKDILAVRKGIFQHSYHPGTFMTELMKHPDLGEKLFEYMRKHGTGGLQRGELGSGDARTMYERIQRPYEDCVAQPYHDEPGCVFSFVTRGIHSVHPLLPDEKDPNRAYIGCKPVDIRVVTSAGMENYAQRADFTVSPSGNNQWALHLIEHKRF